MPVERRALERYRDEGSSTNDAKIEARVFGADALFHVNNITKTSAMIVERRIASVTKDFIQLHSFLRSLVPTSDIKYPEIRVTWLNTPEICIRWKVVRLDVAYRFESVIICICYGADTEMILLKRKRIFMSQKHQTHQVCCHGYQTQCQNRQGQCDASVTQSVHAQRGKYWYWFSGCLGLFMHNYIPANRLKDAMISIWVILPDIAQLTRSRSSNVARRKNASIPLRKPDEYHHFNTWRRWCTLIVELGRTCTTV